MPHRPRGADGAIEACNRSRTRRDPGSRPCPLHRGFPESTLNTSCLGTPRARLIHLWLPTLAFAVLWFALEHSWFDYHVAQLFYDPVTKRFPAQRAWWSYRLIHEAGRKAILYVAIAGLLCWLASFALARLKPARRAAGYLALVIVLVQVFIVLGQRMTNLNCPWALEPFGGSRPYVRLLEPRFQGVKHGQCFPARHAGGGYSLFACYFVLRERRRRLARAALAGACAVGITFGYAQWARGAHFPSHDLFSAYLAWLVALGLYHWPFRSRLWPAPATPPAPAA